MSTDNHINILIELYNKINRIFGLRILVMNNKKASKEIGIPYKVYTMLKMSLFLSVMIYSLILNNMNIYNKMPTPLLFTICISHLMVSLSYILVIFKSTFSKNETYKSMISGMSDGIKMLNMNTAENCAKFKKRVILLHFLIFVLKIVHILIYYFTFNNYLTIFVQIVFITIDLELVHFAIEVNLAARMFESFNRQMTSGKKACSVQNGILALIWQNNEFQNDKVSQNRLDFMIKFLNIYHLLADIINNMNYFYGYLVICIFILNLGTLRL